MLCQKRRWSSARDKTGLFEIRLGIPNGVLSRAFSSATSTSYLAKRSRDQFSSEKFRRIRQECGTERRRLTGLSVRTVQGNIVPNLYETTSEYPWLPVDQYRQCSKANLTFNYSSNNNSKKNNGSDKKHGYNLGQKQKMLCAIFGQRRLFERRMWKSSLVIACGPKSCSDAKFKNWRCAKRSNPNTRRPTLFLSLDSDLNTCPLPRIPLHPWSSLRFLYLSRHNAEAFFTRDLSPQEVRRESGAWLTHVCTRNSQQLKNNDHASAHWKAAPKDPSWEWERDYI